MSIINKPPQHVKREYELEEPVALVVEKYATFIDSTPLFSYALSRGQYLSSGHGSAVAVCI
jgi:hypothetical protein